MMSGGRAGRTRHHHHHLSAGGLTGLLVIMWVSAAMIGTLANKTLMMTWPRPFLLTSMHLLCAAFGDALLVYLQRRRRQRRLRRVSSAMSTSIMKVSVVIGLASACCKALTFFSYGKLTVSLTHTIKASSPLFGLILSRFVYGRSMHAYEMFSIVPICVGVALSSSSELQFAWTGFIAALLSTCIGVLQSMYTKHVMIANNADPIILHFCTSICAFCMSAPVSFLSSVSSSSAPASSSSSPGPGSLAAVSGPALPWLATSLICQYVQAICSMLTLSRISVIGHQVSSVSKRLAVISTSLWYFSTPVTASNLVGMVLALGGFTSYVITHAQTKPASTFKRRTSSPSAAPLAAPPSASSSAVDTAPWTSLFTTSKKKKKHKDEADQQSHENMIQDQV